MSYIEKEWLTSAGLRAKVVVMPMGHRCGYVGVNAETFKGKGYDDLDVEVHGGLTYARTEMDGLRWYGFDCAHLGDARDIKLMDEKHKACYDEIEHEFWFDEGVVRSLDYCITECENLAIQLRQLEDAE